MKSTSASQARGLITGAFGEFLRSPPEGIPAEILDALGSFVRASGGSLLPHLFYETVEQAPVAVSITDAHANILYVNAAFERLTGYSRDEVIGKNESFLSNKATPREVYVDLWRTITNKRAWQGTLVNRRKNGESYLADLMIAPVLSRNGKIANYLGMHRNITNMHRLQQQVVYQKGLTESVLDAAPIVVALLNARGKVLLDNQEYKKLLGDLRGREPAELLIRGLSDQLGCSYPELMEERRSFRDLELRLDLPGTSGPRWFSCSGTWVKQPDRSASGYFATEEGEKVNLLLLAHETTAERRDAHRSRLQHLRATLAEQQMGSGVREALAAATYQIQKPLNMLNAALAMAQRSQGDNHLLPVLEQVAESAQQALRTLNAAMPTEPQEAMMPQNLNEVLQDVLELSTERLLAAGIVIDWLPTPVLPTVNGRTKQLRGLFMYLLDNAITVLEQSGQGQRQISLTTEVMSRTLRIQIEDNGPGIPREDRLTVFEPLFSAWKNARGHAGMGLAMAQEIANQHGGDIEIDSDLGQGCRVRVVLPVDHF